MPGTTCSGYNMGGYTKCEGMGGWGSSLDLVVKREEAGVQQRVGVSRAGHERAERERQVSLNTWTEELDAIEKQGSAKKSHAVNGVCPVGRAKEGGVHALASHALASHADAPPIKRRAARWEGCFRNLTAFAACMPGESTWDCFSVHNT